ncbi:MAG: IS1380 family transposase, partial [Gammaproteobacteria bacterium]
MQTDCNNAKVNFTPLAKRAVDAVFDAGAISSDGGLLLLREVDRKINLLDRVNQLISDPRNPLFTEHDQRTLIAQRVLAIACGWEDLNDHSALRNDLVMQLASGREAVGKKPGEGDVDPDRPLASASTLCRLENRIDRSACVEINKLLVELYIESHGSTPPAEIVLDFDATNDPIHGHQEGRFFHGYYDEYCFLPLYVFAGEQLLCAYLRPSDIDGSKHSWAILSLITKRLRQAWPDVKIIFRGDSGFCRWKMLRWCDRHNVQYIIGLAQNAVLNRRTADVQAQAEQQYKESGQKQRLFQELYYAAGTWDQERRVIARIEHTAKGANPRYVVTNMEGDIKDLYEQTYCARGEMENRIKEQQLGLFAARLSSPKSDRTSCHEFIANQFRLLLSSMAYVLIETLRRTMLAGTEMAQAQAST